MTPTTHDRFRLYDPDWFGWLAIKARAKESGRTPTEQEAWEDDQASRLRAEIHAASIAVRDTIFRVNGGVSSVDRREELFGTRSYLDACDAMDKP